VFDESSFPAKDHAMQQLLSKINASVDVPFLMPPTTTFFEPCSTTQPNATLLVPTATSSAASSLDSPEVSPPPLLTSPIL
jgi:hypothetical protein